MTGSADRPAVPDSGRAAARDSGRAATWHPPAATAGLRLLLVRHGATAATAERRYSGRGDVPLSVQGMMQAKAAGGRVAALVDQPLAAIISSPLRRCLQTAEAIVSPLPVLTDPDLVECDFGAWEGLTFAEVALRYPEQLGAWMGSTAIAPPGGESFQDVGRRAERWLCGLRQAYPTGLVVAVTHVSPIKLILREALAAGDAFLHRCYLSPAGISTIDFYPDGGIAVRAVNETAHLDGAAGPTSGPSTAAGSAS